MVQLPRSPLPPTRTLEDAPVLVTSQETDKNRIYVDKNCQVSNDPPEDGEIPDLNLCNYREFRCSATGDQDEATAFVADDLELIVPYQFELHYNPDADFERLVQYFEEASLEHLAAVTNTIGCVAFGSGSLSDSLSTASSSNNSNGRGRRRGLQQEGSFTDDQLAQIAGVGSEPNDFIDERFADCLNPPADDSSSACAPMLGGFTLFLTPNADMSPESQAALADSVRGVLRDGMEQDLFVSPGNIEKVIFVESREPIVSDATKGGPVQGNGSGVSSKAMGLIAGAAGLLVLILVFLMAMFRRNQKETDIKRSIEVAKADEALSLDGSLAEQDSLALAPQELLHIPEDGILPGEYENSQPIVALPVSNNFVVLGRSRQQSASSDVGQASTFGSVYLTDDETARVNVQSTFSDLEKSVVAEAESTEQEYIVEETPRPVMRFGSEELSLEHSASLASEDYETSSDYTPRRMLQMS